jgi:hypothetical protein
MSGGGPPTPPTPPYSCERVQTVPLNSPQPAIVASLNVNERLFVILDSGSGRRILQVRTSNGDIAGSLTFLGHLSMMECIEQGYSYEAIVLAISGGNIQLRIEPV